MNNMEIYEKVSSVPKEAQKPIAAGRLKGMTDINPMWRIKMLTEIFGPVGFGWKPVIKDKRIEEGAAGVKCAFVDIDLYVKHGGEWSEAIPGTGGSAFVASEQKGLYTSDECFKMAFTDALSVACKALGFGADVYWAGGQSKYEKQNEESDAPLTYESALAHQVTFGQYKGKTLAEIWKEDFSYIKWLSEKGDKQIKEAISVIYADIKRKKEQKPTEVDYTEMSGEYAENQ